MATSNHPLQDPDHLWIHGSNLQEAILLPRKHQVSILSSYVTTYIVAAGDASKLSNPQYYALAKIHAMLSYSTHAPDSPNPPMMEVDERELCTAIDSLFFANKLSNYVIVDFVEKLTDPNGRRICGITDIVSKSPVRLRLRVDKMMELSRIDRLSLQIVALCHELLHLFFTVFAHCNEAALDGTYCYDCLHGPVGLLTCPNSYQSHGPAWTAPAIAMNKQLVKLLPQFREKTNVFKDQFKAAEYTGIVDLLNVDYAIKYDITRAGGSTQGLILNP